MIAVHSISRHLSLTESVVVDGKAGKDAWMLLEEPFFSLDTSLEGVGLSFGGSLTFSEDFPSSFTLSFVLVVFESINENTKNNKRLNNTTYKR